MMYALIHDGEIVRIASLNAMFPHVSFPESGPDKEWLDMHGVRPVVETLVVDPEIEVLEAIPPVPVGDEVRMCLVRPLTEQELEHRQALKLSEQWAAIRSQRDLMLTACDWTQMPDVDLANKQDWAVYRQALRDITLQYDPFAIVWPVAPT